MREFKKRVKISSPRYAVKDIKESPRILSNMEVFPRLPKNKEDFHIKKIFSTDSEINGNLRVYRERLFTKVLYKAP